MHPRVRLCVIAIIAASSCRGGSTGNSPNGPSTPQANSPPVIATVSASADRGLQAATLFAFSAQASDPDGDSLAYVWDFGDQTSGSGLGPTHVYQTSGTWTVRVTVSDGKATVAGQKTVTVRDVSGVWLHPWTVATCNAATKLTLTQTGAAFSGTEEAVRLSGNCDGVGLGTGPRSVSGSIRTPAPPLRWTVAGDKLFSYYTAEVNEDVTRLDVTGCVTHPVTGVETCVRPTGLYDPLTRQQ